MLALALAPVNHFCILSSTNDFMPFASVEAGSSPWQRRWLCRTQGLIPLASFSPVWSGDITTLLISFQKFLFLNELHIYSYKMDLKSYQLLIVIITHHFILLFFRWTKLRINMLPGTVLEPVSECFLASLIIGWAAHYVFRYAANQRASYVDTVFGLEMYKSGFIIIDGVCVCNMCV